MLCSCTRDPTDGSTRWTKLLQKSGPVFESIMDRSRTTNLPKLAEQYRGLSDLILDSELFRLDAMLHQPVASEPKLQQDGVQQEMESSTDSFHAPDDDDIFDDFIDFGQEY